MLRRLYDLLERMLQHIEKTTYVLQSFERTLIRMETVSTAQMEQVTTAIATLKTQDAALAAAVGTLQTSVTNVTTYIGTLQEQAAAGTPVDLTSALSDLNSLATGDATLTTDVSGAVTGITAASTPPAAAGSTASGGSSGGATTTGDTATAGAATS